MGINVRVQNASKSSVDIIAQVKLEKDLRSCMRCRFFYGNNSQCLAKECVKEERKPEITEQDRDNMCFECPYKQAEKYCFPCMKKLLGKKGKETEKFVSEQEEKEDG